MSDVWHAVMCDCGRPECHTPSRTLVEKPGTTWHVRLEWKPQDCWIGVFWKRVGGDLNVWVCLLPMLPLHLYQVTKP